MSLDVVVLGSANIDLVMRVSRYPRPGETVTAERVGEVPGGKGLNQAVAASRAGARTAFVGAVGSDRHGTMLTDVMAAEDIDTSAVRNSALATGLAVIALQQSGENSIFVLPGANAEVGLEGAGRDLVTGAKVLVTQLEVPVPAVIEALAAAQGAGVRTILNAAPAVRLEDSLLRLVDVLVVNEHEARLLGELDDPLQSAARLSRLAGVTVVTLGAEGAAEVTRDGAIRRYPGVPARTIDTTGAGDTFVGVLAAALARGDAIGSALRRSVAAGALAVESVGAVPSIPTASQVDLRLAVVDTDRQ